MKIYTIYLIEDEKHTDPLKSLVIKRLRADTKFNLSFKGYRHIGDLEARTKKEVLLRARRLVLGIKK